MTPPVLNYQLLSTIADLDRHHHLEVRAVEVACLRDVSKGVSIGDVLPFVAVTDFVLAETNPLVGRLPNCGNKTVLMSIDARGILKSDIDGIELDVDSASKWIAEHFHFEFRARGSERNVFRQAANRTVVIDDHTTWLPWIQEINTSSLRGASLDVDFTVTAKAPPVVATKSRVLLSRAKTGFEVQFDNARVLFALKVDGDYADPEKLEKQGYWLTLHSDTKPDLKLAVEVIEVEMPSETTTKKPSKALPAGNVAQKQGNPS